MQAYWLGQNQGSRNEWFFDIVSGGIPLLPKASYRIRSFNTSYLLTMPQTAKGEVGNPYVTQQDPNNDLQKVNHIATIILANLVAVVFNSSKEWLLHDFQPCNYRFPGCFFFCQCRERDSSNLSV